MPHRCATREGRGRPGERLQLGDSQDFSQVRFMESYESKHSDHEFTAKLAAKLGVTQSPLRLDSQAKYGKPIAHRKKLILVLLQCQAMHVRCQHTSWHHLMDSLLHSDLKCHHIPLDISLPFELKAALPQATLYCMAVRQCSACSKPL